MKRERTAVSCLPLWLVLSLVLGWSAGPLSAQQQEQPATASDAPQAEQQDDPAEQDDLAEVFEPALSPKSIDDLKVIQRRVHAILPRVQAATVGVINLGNPARRIAGGGQGSGVIVSEDGYVMTAGHVVNQPGVNLIIVLPDGTQKRGVALGTGMHDTGLAKITDEGNYPFMEMGHSTDLKLGQWCVAVGHPGGFNVRRPAVVRVGRVIGHKNDVIWSDCKLLAGDSGGPLFDLDGKVIGIHSRIGGSIEGNYHVPVDLYHDTWQYLVEGKPNEQVIAENLPARLGIVMEDQESGVTIVEVRDESAAKLADLRPGDVITHYDRVPVTGREQLKTLVAGNRPFDQVTLTVRRAEQTLLADAVMGYEGNLVTGSNSNLRNMQRFQGTLARTLRTNGAKVVETVAAVLRPMGDSVVRIKAQGKDVALGTIISADGFILTKASELNAEPIAALLDDERGFLATVVATDRTADLALLKVDAENLPAVQWGDATRTDVGQWVTTLVPGGEKDSEYVGVLGVPRRRLQSTGVLGVRIEDATQPYAGIRVMGVENNSGAQAAGIRNGDVITHLNDKRANNRLELINMLADFQPEDRVAITFIRDGESLVVDVTLSDRMTLFPEEEDMRSRVRMMSGPISKRRDYFSWVLQHDIHLKPEQCGGPLLGLDGKALGLNIARVNRSETYALPADLVLQTIERLKAQAAKHVEEAKPQDEPGESSS